jgi:hypothetical protein
VFVRTEMEEGDNPSSHDPRIWIFNANDYVLQYQGQLYNQTPESERYPCQPIMDFQYTYPLNDDVIVGDYGKINYLNMQNPTAGRQCLDDPVLRMGKSNARDGYIIYTVPQDAQLSDMVIIGSFSSFGSPWWYLVKR